MDGKLQRRFFTGAMNNGRFDLFLTAQPAAGRAPKKLSPLRRGATVTLEWNRSDGPTGDYALLDLRPSLSATWPF